MATRTRNEDEIAAEIAALKACKTYAPKRSVFGENNHANIDLQITELEEEFDQTSEEWNELTPEEQMTVLDARDWADGHSDEAPSAGWDTFKPKSA